ncbi:hypothetical protein WICPIJ_007497 [Wickerhamomyces pijperi]|uniref:Condensin complex subunit 1 n=1 Tax=Wickerhamomyces pijperi TaxID=599730 RepID=A0A9P8TKC7_WICPI|nr:hypothetical protein WICPIJ_007497 [Wickerhamomyces pijperi]
MSFNLSEALSAFQSAEKDSFKPPSDVAGALDYITAPLANSPEAIRDSGVSDILEELCLSFPKLDKHEQVQVVYSVTSSFQRQVDICRQIIDSSDTESFKEQKFYLEQYAYFTHVLTVHLGLEQLQTSNTNSKKVSSTSLDAFKANCNNLEKILETICYLFKIHISMILVTSPERDLFVNALLRPVHSLMESEPRMKVSTLRMYMYKAICMAVKNHGHAPTAQSTIIQNLNYFTHLHNYMAEMLTILHDQYDHSQLTEDVLREVSNKEFNSNDNNGPKQISQFVTEISAKLPRVLLKQMTLVSNLLNNSNYTLRCAVVESCGNVVLEMCKNQEDLERYIGQISGLIELLTERFLDQNPYVRTKAIQSILKLCESDVKFTKQRQVFIQLAVRHLEDKSSLVRRNAIKLLSRLILSHPFDSLHGSLLTLTIWERRLKEGEAQLKEIEPVETTEEVVARNLEEETCDSDEDEEEQLKSRIETQGDVNAIIKLKLTIQYYKDAIAFIKTIHHGIDIASQLLYSKNKNEVIEAMDLFVLADAYAIEHISVGIRRMLHLVWMKNTADEGTNVTTHLVSCYKKLFLSAPEDASDLEAAALIAKNLISLTYGATIPELASMEKLLGLMYEDDLINETVIKVLWQIYGFQDKKKFSKKQRRGSSIILGMLAVSDNQIAVKGLGSLLTIGLGPKGKEDLLLAKYSCIALNRIVSVDEKNSGKPVKIQREDEAISKLSQLVVEYNPGKEYYSVAEQAINTIFNLASNPEQIATKIIKAKTAATFGGLEEGQSQIVSLSQLLFIVGHIGIKLVVYLEYLEGIFKKKKIEAESKKAKSKEVTGDNELEMIGGTSEDDFSEIITNIKEKELLHGEHSILAKFGPLVREICYHNLEYDNVYLQRSAVLCMEKLMCISPKYCEENLQLLITIMEKSEDPIIRSNAVIGLGDMAVCFNNLVDDNTDFLYRRLHDENLTVKRTCLMTITFLILAGQVKVKGQLSEMAKCLEDPDQSIGDLCRLFFRELATKDNAIYNGFIDIFSGLSSDETLDKDAMKRIIKFLVSFVDKERHIKQLTEKLVQRISKVENQQQWDDVAFVLTSLPSAKQENVVQILETGYTMVESRE